jgi:N-methylhydantoinase A
VFRVGVDIGGTFTDLVVHDGRDGRTHAIKTLSDADPVACLSAALEKAAAELELPLRELLTRVSPAFCFGSTIGVNTLLTRAGARVGVITTRGHGDAYHMFQKERLGHVDLRDAVQKVFKPLLPRRRVEEVDERIDCFGEVVVPLAEDQVRTALRRLVEDEGAEAVVISFLWAHRNPAHEQAARRIARELQPDLFLSVGSELVGVAGEFQRTATAVINAYIGKRVARQSDRVERYLRDAGLEAPVLVMQNLGGLAPLDEVTRRPAYLLKSGPAGGVAGGARIAHACGEPDVVGIDMGGTSLDVSLIKDGDPELSGGFRMLAHPLAIPGVEIDSLGAGGGSIASVQRAGSVASLQVGPASAGSAPGPACYGLGGERPTVTDADLVLGIIDPEARLGDEIPVDLERATAAIARDVAEPLAMSVQEAAWGIYRVVTAQMADALEHFMTRRGLDPARFTMMVFGAAGAMHSSAIARRLGIRRSLVPSLFPVLSAAGLMAADIGYVTRLSAGDVDLGHGSAAADRVTAGLRAAAERPLAMLGRSGTGPAEMQLALGMSFAGQSLELSVDVRSDVLDRALGPAELAELVERWRVRYERIYGSGGAWADSALAVTFYDARGHSRLERVAVFDVPDDGADDRSQPEPTGRRQLFLGAPVDAAVYDEATVRPGMRIGGPAIVQGALRTVLAWPGDEVVVDGAGNLLVSHD